MHRRWLAVAGMLATSLAMQANAVVPLGGAASDGPARRTPVPAPDAALQTPDIALLGVRLNDIDQPDAVLVLHRPGHPLAVPADALTAWRVRRPSGKPVSFEGTEYIELGAIQGARWTEDAATQTLVVQLPSAAFLRNDLEVVNAVRPEQSIARFGGFVNYDLQWQRDGASSMSPGSQLASGLIETGLFSAHGNGLSTGVWRTGTGIAPSFTRLDTTWNVDRTNSMSSWRFGDAISTGGSWGRSARFGGIQWATNFAVQPGLVTFPLPSVRGDATVPSVVDLYINGTQQLQGKVPAGPFDLPNVPAVTGQGQIRLVVRDVLGREQVVVQPYYVSPTLLKPGLHDFAVEAGSLRQDYGLYSNHYGRAFLSATDRAGVDTTFTRELHAEVMRDRQDAGVGVVWQLWQWATANVALAASHGPDGRGGLAMVGVEHQAAAWSAHIQARVTSPAFVTMDQPSGSVLSSLLTAPRNSFSAGFGSSLGHGSVGLDLIAQTSQDGERYRSLTLNYGHSFGSLGYLSAYASRTLGAASGTTIGLNFTTVLDANTSASVGTWRASDGGHQSSLTLQGNTPVGPGIGYQIEADRGAGTERYSLQGTAQGDHATVTGGVAHANGSDAVRLGASGGIALMPEGVYFSRRIDGSFAVVQVGDYPDVRVDRDNQLIGRTDAKGRAFVTGLRGFETNQISVEAGDLPLDAQLDELKIDVAPGNRSGVSVIFPVRRSRGASLRLVTENGEPLPAGLFAHLEGDARSFPIGFDGKLFLTGLADHNQVTVQWDGHHCAVSIESGASMDDVPELGTKVCR